MRKTSAGREPSNQHFKADKEATGQHWKERYNAQLTAANLAIEASESNVETHKLLILVDLQGMYLALHEWLSEQGFPIDDGMILSRFAYLQIRDAVAEITKRIARSRPMPTKDFNELVDAIKVDFADGRWRLGEQLNVQKSVTYLDVEPNFELFHAPAPFEYIELSLKQRAQLGGREAARQLEQLKKGIVEKKGVFVRDYSAYDDFVDCLAKNVEHARTEKGFFTVYVENTGLKTLDEKEVDTRIVMRTMDAFYKKEADSICIVSADQDFLPLHDRASEFGILTFQADLKNFVKGGRIGKKLKQMQGRFIQGRIDLEWPLAILAEAMSDTKSDLPSQYRLSESELRALCDLHNSMNDLKFQLSVECDGRLKMAKL
ncbi:NYN domain-containing protein [Paraburkholderia ginsengisoli]|uniref:NYN domain-containing protein n=1 Tax=Paraburkholderia ginsengisoli TaxID=311231 RepID=A0A7T4N053_9BURK|nr:NYN domain-containing protein [Paraburkholderia ginsengisoli]QQC62771.1 NYN domain-containing protein [Paraburkholderia ginsengisoli]